MRMEVSPDSGMTWGPWNGTITASPGGGPATGTVTNVASSATSVTLLAANTSRRKVSVFNNSTQILYLKCGTTASSSTFTIAMAPNSLWVDDVGYTGRIDGIWASANGSAGVTEYT